jgi:hypothetical protein
MENKEPDGVRNRSEKKEKVGAFGMEPTVAIIQRVLGELYVYSSYHSSSDRVAGVWFKPQWL